MKTFKINEKEYKAKAFDFNMICDLEELGVSLDKMQKTPMSGVRAYFALCADSSLDVAGEELQEHLLNGGSFDDLVSAMSDAMEQSDFFRKLAKK